MEQNALNFIQASKHKCFALAKPIVDLKSILDTYNYCDGDVGVDINLQVLFRVFKYLAPMFSAPG